MTQKPRREPPSSAIPFIAGDDIPLRGGSQPFADIVRKAPVAELRTMLEGWTDVREEAVTFEAAVGRYVTVSAALLGILSDARRAVAHIAAEGVDHSGAVGRWGGTGFLVARNLLLTNHHVLNSREVAVEASVTFDYEIGREALMGGKADIAGSRKVFRLNPKRLFVTSPAIGGLDYTFVWIDEAASTEFGMIPMERASFLIDVGDQAFIVHHPDNEPKQVSLDDTDVLEVLSRIILYASDTLSGSSGAPVFNAQGNLIALHHANRKKDIPLPDGGKTSIVNEGIKLAAIAIDVEAKSQGATGEAAQAREVLSAFGGSDSLTGFFGGLGRKPPPASDLERVVAIYKGDDADLDIGFWNIEHLATRHELPGKLDAAATVIADMKLDVWGLSEVSATSVELLCGRLREKFGERYDFLASDPDAGDSQATALIWRAEAVSATREPWPPEIERLLSLKSTDAEAREFEAVHGKIFDRYPALFRVETKAKFGGKPFVAHVVPLHLKAMPDGSLRRRMASGILARAVGRLAEQGLDNVILGGDMNATLASGDLDKLRASGLVALSAKDEGEGAITYIKSPHLSLIDSIFVSRNLAPGLTADDFMIVARDREIPDFIKSISDHRPVMMRIALDVSLDAGGVATPSSTNKIDIRATLDALIAGADQRSPGPNASFAQTARKITFEELKRMMADPSKPDSELRPYLVPAMRGDGSGYPDARPNPQTVELPPSAEFELESAMAWGNSASRWRRKSAFYTNLDSFPERKILLSEGDSWFQFPLLLDDVIDHLTRTHLVRSLDAAGDTLDNMLVRNPEFLTTLIQLDEELTARGRKVDALLLSAAGNDIIGEDQFGKPALLALLRNHKPGKPAAWHVEPKAMKAALDIIEAGYRKAIGSVRAIAAYRKLPILIHGYDYAIPGGFPDDPRHPGYAAQDKWLGKPMADRAILDPQLQRGIVRYLIDNLNDRMAAIAGTPAQTSVHFVDCRTAVGHVSRWNDEIHPTSDGYATVAELFRRTLDQAIGQSP